MVIVIISPQSAPGADPGQEHYRADGWSKGPSVLVPISYRKVVGLRSIFHHRYYEYMYLVSLSVR
jgi:hypothetical protein